MGMRRGRAFSPVFAALVAVPLTTVGVCGALAPLAAPPAVCPAESRAAGDCCSRSGAPASSPRPASDRCAACVAAACALGETREAARIARRTSASNIADRPGVPRVVLRTAAARSLAILAESPPKIVLLATFRN